MKAAHPCCQRPSSMQPHEGPETPQSYLRPDRLQCQLIHVRVRTNMQHQSSAPRSPAMPTHTRAGAHSHATPVICARIACNANSYTCGCALTSNTRHLRPDCLQCQLIHVRVRTHLQHQSARTQGCTATAQHQHQPALLCCCLAPWRGQWRWSGRSAAMWQRHA